jgi:LPXTG-motif cell wall-anchored protein
MKKLIMFALVSLMVVGGMTKSFAQNDSATVTEEPKDTISIDNIEPKYYEEESPKESSDTMTYVFVGGIVVVGIAAFLNIRRKKK